MFALGAMDIGLPHKSGRVKIFRDNISLQGRMYTASDSQNWMGKHTRNMKKQGNKMLQTNQYVPIRKSTYNTFKEISKDFRNIHI